MGCSAGMRGYLGQGSLNVTCDAGEGTDATYCVEAGVWEDDTCCWHEDIEVQDTNGYALSKSALLAMPPDHRRMIEASIEDITPDR